MTISERLATLSEEVRTTFHPDFIFLIHPDLVQHFPARQWQKEQFLEALASRLGPDYTLDVWEEKVIAISENKEIIAILPKYPSIHAFESE